MTLTDEQASRIHEIIADLEQEIAALEAQNAAAWHGFHLAEDQVFRSERRYEALFNALAEAAFLIRQTDGQILDANHQAVEMYGYTREQLRRMTNRELSAEPDQTSAALIGRLNTVNNRRHKRADGKIITVDIAVAYFVENGIELAVTLIRPSLGLPSHVWARMEGI